MTARNEAEAYPQTNLSNHLLKHQHQMLQFLFYSNYDVVYETFELKHASYSNRRQGHLIAKFKTDQIARIYESTSQKLHLRIIRDDIDLDKQLARLEVLWHNRNIPYFHRYYFLKMMFTTFFKNIQSQVELQQKLIRQETHIYYLISRAINAREACLRQLKKNMVQLTGEDVYQYLHIAKERLFNERRKNQREKYKLQGYKIKTPQETSEGKSGKTKFQFFADSFNHLNKLTIYAIETITKWKEYITSQTHDPRKQKERIQYYFYDDNYFLKILTDLGFLRVSFLSKFYEFAPKNDPFLLNCVLSFQKKQQKTVEHELLKQIFMPQKEHLSQIMSNLQLLSQQYRNNIRSRKVYDLHAIKKQMLLAQQKRLNNEVPNPISNVVLKKIQSPVLQRKSKSLNAFRIRDFSNALVKKDKIVIEFKNDNRNKKIITIPGITERLALQTEDSPLKNSVIIQKNQYLAPSMVDANLLSFLKQQVIKRVRQDFQYKKQNVYFNRNQSLELYIDAKLQQAIKQIFPFQPEKQLSLPIQFTSLRIQETQIQKQLAKIFKYSLSMYSQMQYSEIQLQRKIQNAVFVYIIKGNIGEQIIGHAICTLEKQIKEFKVIRILYLNFTDVSKIQMLILKFVEFLWQYENSYEIHFNFYQPANSQKIQQLIDNIENNLQKQCIFARKQVYSSVMEVKLVFKRNHKNIHYIPNQYPSSMKLCLSSILAEKKLMLENKNQKKNEEYVSYDYLLMLSMKKFINSSDFAILKERIAWKERLKIILEMMLVDENQKSIQPMIKLIQAQNVSQLNNSLSKTHQKLLEISDLVKLNTIRMLKLYLNLSLPYPAKSVYGPNNQQFYRYQIKQKVKFLVGNLSQFYFFRNNNNKESQNYEIILFNARQYLRLPSEQKYLLTYLRKCLDLRKLNSELKEVQHLWIPMCRYPEKYKERQQTFLTTCRMVDLFPIKKDFLVGESFQWFCSMEMQNAIKYQQKQGDVMLEKPFGVAIRATGHESILYSRVFH